MQTTSFAGIRFIRESPAILGTILLDSFVVRFGARFRTRPVSSGKRSPSPSRMPHAAFVEARNSSTRF
jgi:hypothetical protein